MPRHYDVHLYGVSQEIIRGITKQTMLIVAAQCRQDYEKGQQDELCTTTGSFTGATQNKYSTWVQTYKEKGQQQHQLQDQGIYAGAQSHEAHSSRYAISGPRRDIDGALMHLSAWFCI